MSDDSSRRIAQHLRSLAGTLGAGARMPSTRALAIRFGAGPVTVQRAVAAVVADGLIETRPGQGTFVRKRGAGRAVDVGWQTAALGPERSAQVPAGTTLRPVPADTIAMHSGYPDAALLPLREVRAAVARAARVDGSHAAPPVSGLPELRRWFTDELGTDGWHESDALITSGGQAALSATFRGLARPGESIVMESPTYWGAIGAARQAGLVIVPVGRTGGAPSAADLDTAFATSGARLAYVQPNFANPSGEQWDSRQRAEVLDVAAAHRAFLVEDDWAHDLGIDADAHPLAAADTDGRVVYIRSLTKSLSPAVRVAAVLARGPVRSRIESVRAHGDLFVSPILQRAALEVVGQAAWRTHAQRLGRSLGQRRDALVAALRAESGLDAVLGDLAVPAGGIHLWIRLPATTDTGDPTDPRTVAALALSRGLAVSPGNEWFPAEPTGPHLRMSYATEAQDRYAEAASILAAVLRPEA